MNTEANQHSSSIENGRENVEDKEESVNSTVFRDGTGLWINRVPRILPDTAHPVLQFYVPSALVKVADDVSEKRFVNYKLTANHVSQRGPDPNPSETWRRYSEFLTLFEALKKEFPSLMQNVPFPKKCLIGNFTASIISERATAFEKLLQHVISVPELKESKAFLSFLEDSELNRALLSLSTGNTDEAVNLLEKSFEVLSKVYMDRAKPVLLMLCRLVAVCTSSATISISPAAEKWADLALKRYKSVCDADLLVLYVPLLKTCTQLFFLIGRDNTDLDAHLADMEKRGFKVKNSPSLSEAIEQADPRPNLH